MAAAGAGGRRVPSQASHRSLEPLLRLPIDLAHVPTTCRDWRPDNYPYGAGPFHQTAPRPEITRVVCDGNDESARLGSEQSATHTVAPRLPGLLLCVFWFFVV